MCKTVCQMMGEYVEICAQDLQYGMEKGLKSLNVPSISKKGLEFKAKIQTKSFKK